MRCKACDAQGADYDDNTYCLTCWTIIKKTAGSSFTYIDVLDILLAEGDSYELQEIKR